MQRPLTHEDGQVDEVHGDRPLQRDALPFHRGERLVDPFRRPLGLVLQHEARECRRIRDTHAAVTRRPLVVGEQATRRRVVQVHGELVREEELHVAKGVLRPRALPDAITPRSDVLHTEGALNHRRILSLPRNDLVVVRLEVAGVLLCQRQDLLDRDLLRDVPVRTELHELHRVGEDRGLPSLELITHHHAHVEDLASTVEGLEVIVRDVHDDASPRQHGREPAQPLEIGGDLVGAAPR